MYSYIVQIYFCQSSHLPKLLTLFIYGLNKVYSFNMWLIFVLST